MLFEAVFRVLQGDFSICKSFTVLVFSVGMRSDVFFQTSECR